MYPILWQDDGLLLPTWHVTYCIASIVSYFVLHHLTRYHHRYSSFQTDWLYIYLYLSGYLGARAWGYVFEGMDGHHFLLMGPMTFYGGFIGCTTVGLLYILYYGRSFYGYVPSALISGFCGLAIGRIGCFLNGDDFGISISPSNPFYFLTVVFPHHLHPLPRLPVQLFESSGALVIFLVGFLKYSTLIRALGPLRMSLHLASSYAILRGLLEFIRDDDRGQLVSFGISHAQGISLLILSITFFFEGLIWGKKKLSLTSSHSCQI